MREILFRARTVSESEYMDDGEWIEGFYTCFNGDEHRIYTGYSETDCGDHYPDWFNVIPETVGQFTGLTDKNGKKIFEGDIGRYKQTDGAKENGKPIICTGVVLYNEKTASFAVESKDEKGRKYFDYFPIKDFEIIGNIHDNPELLKGDNNE